ncbi:hypothetical protein Tco_0052747 [Tanacetum coccineum]
MVDLLKLDEDPLWIPVDQTQFCSMVSDEQMAPVQLSTGPAPSFLTPGHISSGLVPNPVPAAPYVPPTNENLEILSTNCSMNTVELLVLKDRSSSSSSSSFPVNINCTYLHQLPLKRCTFSKSFTVIFGITISKFTSSVAAESPLMEDNPFAPIGQ